ncbi:MAG: ribosome-associated translation inhibitor RaiA [bacterium]
MNLSITARHIEIDEAIKDYLRKRLNKLKKYFNKKEVNIHVVLMAEKTRRGIEVVIDFNGNTLTGHQTSPDIYTSIDQVVDKLERQLKKCKEKVQKKARVCSKTITVTPQKMQKISRKKLTSKPMTLKEAIIELEQASLEFFVFTDVETGLINVLYRTKNGTYGLIEP